MEVLTGLALFLFFTVLIERTTELVFGTPFEKVEQLQPYKWLLMYVAVAVGVGAAFVFQLDLIAHVTGISREPFGFIFTGVACGGGSNLLHQVWPGAAVDSK